MSLATSVLEAKVRQGTGKGFARRVRSGGLVPAVVYGRSLEKPFNIAVQAKALKAAVNTPKKLNTLITLKVEGMAGETTVLLKEYQLDPVSKDLLHADFIAVKETEQVKVRIPVVLTGKAEGVVAGGILSQVRRELEIFALPTAIPQSLEIDVTPLRIGGSIHIKDVKLPEGVNVKTQANFTVAVITAPEVEKVVEALAAVAAPGAAPAAGAAAGAAPAAGDKKAAPGDKKAEAAKPAAKK